ncbi:MAG: winged helix-turn-helix domain-containing protein [Anaerolineales bacterium]|jgi:DNA-binding transcriptional ArsR family regulator
MPNPDTIILPEVTTVDIRLDQVQNFINSMLLVVWSEERSGLSPWIYETAAALKPAQLKDQKVVMLGLHYAVLPGRFWKDVPTYLAGLEKVDPIDLRDQVLDFYLNFTNCNTAENTPDATKETLLADVNFFLDYLRSKFGEEAVFPEIETEAFRLLNDPPAMQAKIVSHLRMMWQDYFQDEWERTKPMLEDAVLAFEKIEFGQMEKGEVVNYITGREVSEEFWEQPIQEANRLIFVPSAHNGPYLNRFHYKNALGIIFGARLPKDTDMHAPDLSRNEITIRLNALADDVRLNILKHIAVSGEMRSQEIIEELGLSQSAASRHLNQLSATGYLIERRCSGAKCYSLNRERVQDTMRAVEAFLLCE